MLQKLADIVKNHCRMAECEDAHLVKFIEICGL